jgi:soluble lytic murein transglycosylase-like protein
MIIRGFLVSIPLICALQLFAQQPAPASEASSQQERVEAAMKNSLAAQQAAIDAIRAKGEPESLRTQSESIARQVDSIQGRHESPKPAAAQVASAAAETEVAKTFFSLPWSPSTPLAVPNVQMVDDSCQAMAQDQVDKLVQNAAQKERLEVGLLKSVMRQESAFKPCAVSTAGAMGLMQIMPETADLLGLEDPFDPAKNTEAGAHFLKMMLDRYQGDVPMALGAYNAGPGRVDKAGGVPPIAETIQYVTSILRNLSLDY